MHNIVSIAEDQVRQAVLRAAGEAVAAGELPAEPMPAFVVEVPGDRAHGILRSTPPWPAPRRFAVRPARSRMSSANIWT